MYFPDLSMTGTPDKYIQVWYFRTPDEYYGYFGFFTSVTDSQFPVTDISDEITLWLLNIAMENGSFTNDFDDSPIKNGDSPSYPLVN